MLAPSKRPGVTEFREFWRLATIWEFWREVRPVVLPGGKVPPNTPPERVPAVIVYTAPFLDSMPPE